MRRAPVLHQATRLKKGKPFDPCGAAPPSARAVCASGPEPLLATASERAR
eukprot:CAMPEP_0185204448 /NCGR_PEP_ID=MMETSP1140-20130426/54858_1 /TAXON_ID=298111 /ORGANISM="Pavlova sp., Strain CCMP459" /LENGTH=49 /DNA_ID= /DNA_START= /DNA_END= /DNA_ORIENTATION=